MRLKLGGRCTKIVSGGAALSAELSAWLSRCFLVNVFQGYGMTESCGGVVIQTPPYHYIRHRGGIGLPCTRITLRLVDVPDMNYMHTDNPPRGEIWMQGPTVFQGYFQDQAKTAEAIQTDGHWLRTGDIAMVNDDGSLTIVDRKKNIFKLAQGEYVAAEFLETMFARSSLIAQAWIHGEPTDTFVVVMAVPNPESLVDVAKALGIPATTSLPDLCKNPKVVEHCLADIVRIAKEQRLPGFQIPRALYLTPEPWTVENDLITPTFKLKRPALKARFAQALAEISAPIRSAEK
jgi:long-chain acyl-CoA synthetase